MAKVKRWWAGAGRGILQTHEAKIRIALQIHSHTHTPIHTGAHKEVARQRQIHAKHFVAAYLENFVLDFDFCFGFLDLGFS